MMVDTDTINEKLSALEAGIRRAESRSDQLVDVIRRLGAVMIANGDAELLQQAKAILADYRAGNAALPDASNSRMH